MASDQLGPRSVFEATLDEVTQICFYTLAAEFGGISAAYLGSIRTVRQTQPVALNRVYFGKLLLTPCSLTTIQERLRIEQVVKS